MPTMTAAMIASGQELKNLIQDVDDALEAARAGANASMNMMYSVTGADAAAAHILGNGLFKLRGQLREMRAQMDEYHAEISTAAIVYDPANGVDLVHFAPPGGPGGR